MDYNQLPTNKQRLNFILDHGLNFLTGWEHDFVNSLKSKISKDKDLNWKQQKKLIEIHRKCEQKIG